MEREAESARLARAIEGACSEAGAFVLVEGPAGIGKSRLLDEGRTLALERGVRVLRARGGELERDFAYGVVRQLLERPVVELGEPDRKELLNGAAGLAAPALGLTADGAGGTVDPSFGVMNGLYWLTSNLATREPLLLEVDDAHWCDNASLRFLLYLASRLEGLPIALAAAVRPTEPGTNEPLLNQLRASGAATAVRPAPLTVDGVTAVVRERFKAPPAREFSEACHRVTAGNPFLLGELVSALQADGTDPSVAGAAAIRELGPDTIAHSVLLRLGRLPDSCEALARALAVMGTQAELSLAARLAALHIQEASVAADALVAVEVLAPERPLRFVHPIVRAAIYSELPPSERVAMHARAAAVLQEGGASARELAIHLLAVDPTGDSRVVDSLREAGTDAIGQGAADSAQRYLRRALAEPPGEEILADLLFELGFAEFLVGEDLSAAIEHLRRSVELTEEPDLQAIRVLGLARALFFSGDVTDAFEVLEHALAELEGRDSESVVRLQVEHATVGLVHPPTAPRAVRRLEGLERGEAATPADLLRICNLAAWKWIDDGTAEEVAGLAEQALAGGRLVASEGCESIPVYEAAWTLTYADRHELATETLSATLAEARRRGSVFGFITSCAVRAIVATQQGDMRAVEAEARNGIELGLVPPFVRPSIFSSLARALMERGQLDEADAAIAESGCGPYLPEMVHMNPAFYVRGLLRMAQGQSEDALADFLELGGRSERLGVRNPAIPWRCGAAEAHLRLGNLDEAKRLVAEHWPLVEHWGTASARGMALRTQGLVEGAEGVDTLRRAVNVLSGSPDRFQHARALVEFGASLRRSGHRRDAREPLREGLELARRCGATVLVERAHSELITAGAKPRRLQFSGVEALTASERRVADMASAGQSNREIAEALYVTVKTVENHLSRTYSKLDIGSREELSAALA
ncbi:MAG: AAA family ATPase [Actinomycetota bacterium]|nr:AAA family ATPase [Actinomycetota bacterium]